jgi:hypothetical protein
VSPREGLVLSLSRSRDVLKDDPGKVAAVLRGEEPVRLSRAHALAPLDLGALGAVVLWSKDPRALGEHDGVRAALLALHQAGVAVALQVTVTGLGGTPLEPGIPAWPETLAALERVLDYGLLPAAAVKLRYDPVGALRDAAGHLWSNREPGLTVQVLDAAAALGIKRVTASRMEVAGYVRVAQRLRRHGLTEEPWDEDQARAWFRWLAGECDRRGMRYSTCVNPEDPVLAARPDVEGCIDGAWLNSLLDSMGSPRRVTHVPHNQRGQQRPQCRCTFSYDAGYTPGMGHCYNRGASFCWYCFSAAGEPRSCG